jgi:hypothetical protein
MATAAIVGAMMFGAVVDRTGRAAMSEGHANLE